MKENAINKQHSENQKLLLSTSFLVSFMYFNGKMNGQVIYINATVFKICKYK